jgi:hypothetical protein
VAAGVTCAAQESLVVTAVDCSLLKANEATRAHGEGAEGHGSNAFTGLPGVSKHKEELYKSVISWNSSLICSDDPSKKQASYYVEQALQSDSAWELRMERSLQR